MDDYIKEYNERKELEDDFISIKKDLKDML